MGGALARAVARVDSFDLYLADNSEEKAEALANDTDGCVCDSATLASECDIIFLAVKPNIIATVAKEIKGPVCARKPLIVTMAAGVKIEALEAVFARTDVPIIRIMPNTPAAVGCGMITWCKNEAVSKKNLDAFESALSYAGELDSIPENLIDAASAVAGCGPAFVYMFADALADGGVAVGLPRSKALSYAIETIIGAGEMMKQSEKHPAQLKDEVCSPGGSTIEGVAALENGAFRATVSSAVTSAFLKTKKLGENK